MTARLRIDLDALAANYAAIAAGVEAAGAVVKADAYGLGAAAVAPRLLQAGCRDFFVASCAEALSLRAVLGMDQALRIFCFEGPLPDTAAQLAAASIVPVINDAAQLQLWSAHRQLPAAIHVDTGMTRLGFAPEALTSAILEGYAVGLLLTHFACADDPEAPANRAQSEQFARLCARFPDIPVSMGNSAASLAPAVPTRGLARPGIALYGGQPLLRHPLPLQTVVTFEAQVLQVREVAAGTHVGYGGSWTAPRPCTLAVLGVGYADGVRRQLAGRGCVIAAGQRAPMVGRISMDLTVVDVTGLGVQSGDWLELFGPQLPLAEVASWLDTIDYEVLTSIGPRVAREYLTPS